MKEYTYRSTDEQQRKLAQLLDSLAVEEHQSSEHGSNGINADKNTRLLHSLDATPRLVQDF